MVSTGIILILGWSKRGEDWILVNLNSVLEKTDYSYRSYCVYKRNSIRSTLDPHGTIAQPLGKFDHVFKMAGKNENNPIYFLGKYRQTLSTASAFTTN